MSDWVAYCTPGNLTQRGLQVKSDTLPSCLLNQAFSLLTTRQQLKQNKTKHNTNEVVILAREGEEHRT